MNPCRHFLTSFLRHSLKKHGVAISLSVKGSPLAEFKLHTVFEDCTSCDVHTIFIAIFLPQATQFYGDTSQSGIGANGIWLAKETVPRRKATVKKFQQIDLTAVKRYQTEILVRNFDYIIISIEIPGTSECGISPQTYSTRLAAFDSRLTLPF